MIVIVVMNHSSRQIARRFERITGHFLNILVEKK